MTWPDWMWWTFGRVSKAQNTDGERNAYRTLVNLRDEGGHGRVVTRKVSRRGDALRVGLFEQQVSHHRVTRAPTSKTSFWGLPPQHTTRPHLPAGSQPTPPPPPLQTPAKMRRAIPRLRSSLATASSSSTFSTVAAANAARLPRPAALATSTFARTYASDSPSIPERIRRKLWGTEKPPGPEDPYSTETAVAVAPTPEELLAANYVPAIDGRELFIVGVEDPLGVWEIDRWVVLGLGVSGGRLGG